MEDFDAIVIAQNEADIMICFDIFCDAGKSMKNIIEAVASENCKNVIYGFTPKGKKKCNVKVVEEDDTTFFINEAKENIFDNKKLMFPLLTHA